MRAEIARISPEDVDGYDAYMKVSEAIFKVGFEQLGDVPFSKWTDMLKIAPEMIRLSSHRSVYSVVSKFFKHPHLRIVFSFHPLLIGGNPFTASSIYCLIAFLERRWGVHFAMGGTGRLVEGLVKLIHGQGGTLHFRQDVREIIVRNGAACGVRLASGEVLDADIVVSNADSATTYRYLLPSAARSRWSDKKIERALFDQPVRLVFRDPQEISRRAAPRCCSARATRNCCMTCSRARSLRMISACICITPPSPIHRWRRTVAMPSMCCRRCRIWRAAPTGA